MKREDIRLMLLNPTRVPFDFVVDIEEDGRLVAESPYSCEYEMRSWFESTVFCRLDETKGRLKDEYKIAPEVLFDASSPNVEVLGMTIEDVRNNRDFLGIEMIEQVQVPPRDSAPLNSFTLILNLGYVDEFEDYIGSARSLTNQNIKYFKDDVTRVTKRFVKSLL